MLLDSQLRLYEKQSKAILDLLAKLYGHYKKNKGDNFCFISKHPIAARIYRDLLSSQTVEINKIEDLWKYLITRIDLDLEKLKRNEILLINSSYVLPEFETRNKSLLPDFSIDENSEEKINCYKRSLTAKLNKKWFEFINIISSFTPVLFDNKKPSHLFSGTYSNAFGSIHSSIPDSEEKFIEIFTHEAGHLWLDLLIENDKNFIKNSYESNIHISPWRSDPRPLEGIYQGCYVFTNVLSTLAHIHSIQASTRVMELSIEVNDGIDQVLKFGILSSTAEQIIMDCKLRVTNIIKGFDSSLIVDASIKYKEKKANKISKLTQSELHYV